MNQKESRKESIRKFKERRPLLGAYAVRCTANGRVWVGVSRNLEATRNGSWFCLRGGLHQDQSLQKEWNTEGESAFQYEILESIDNELNPLNVQDLLKEKRNEWIARLSALPLR
jgi:hypothetical protein